MKIVNLRDCEYHIKEISQWHFNEWSYLYPDKTLLDFEGELRESLGNHLIPQTWLIFDNNVVCGTASLLVYDMKTNRELSPWLANVYILESKRGKGLGKQIVSTVTEKAFKLGLNSLYLFTDKQLDFYKKLGWVHIKDELYESNLVYIMKYNY